VGGLRAPRCAQVGDEIVGLIGRRIQPSAERVEARIEYLPPRGTGWVGLAWKMVLVAAFERNPGRATQGDDVVLGVGLVRAPGALRGESGLQLQSLLRTQLRCEAAC